MKGRISVLSLTVFLQAGVSWAQLAPVNELGLSWGHLHLAAPDREKEAKAWIRLGGELENNFSGNIPIGFPGIVILVGGQHPVTGGSAGSEVDHVAFRVPDLQASLTKWRGVKTWWLPERPSAANKGMDGNWGLTIQPGSRPDQAFVTTPAGTKIEILEDKKLKAPIVFDHVHFYVVESRLKEIQDYYTKMYGAKPEHSSMGMSRVLDGFGTIVEITKAQGAYFDPKLLDASFYEVDEGGRKKGDPPRQ